MKKLALVSSIFVCLFLLTASAGKGASRLLRTNIGSTIPPVLTAWIINTDGHTNPHFAGAVDVQSVQQTSINGIPYAQVHSNSIADYYTTVSAQLLQELNGRPRAATDFRLGHTTVTQGQVIRFGDDIGYNSAGCTLGYWPPGPGCPSARNRTFSFPMQPILATQAISTSMGAIGLWVNGTAVYNWSDAQSYNRGNVWFNTALTFEVYDMDICPGHAAQGDYHHHSFPDCIASLLGDNGQSDSPVYGFAADGFPIYGPWESAGVLAQSGWRTRDYDTAGSLTWCGTAHVRNCLLRNPLDPTQGTVPASQVGPRTDVNLTTMSGNVISATSGIYLQDYWYDRSCSTCLDEHNGHDLHDGRGYHYHTTVRTNPSGGRPIPVFPYIVGPTYAGQLQPSVTYTPTPTETASAPTVTASPTLTATPTNTGTATATPSPSPVPPELVVGHVLWQGPAAQPSSAQQLPLTLTLKAVSTGSETNYPAQTTDASGFFTVSLSGLAPDLYNWRVKGPRYLANAGSIDLAGTSAVQADMGTMRAGDANNDNVTNATDFNIVKNTFGRSPGDPGYDSRADFNNDSLVNSADFVLMKANFGTAGARPLNPAGAGR